MARSASLPGSQAAPRYRSVVGWALIGLLLLVVLTNVWRLWADPSAPFASDWLWYHDGAVRLLSAQPLYNAGYLAGPYDQLSAGLQYSYNLAPGLAPLLVPLSVLPETLQAGVWAVLMAASLAVAFAMVWPGSMRRGASVLLVVLLAILPPVLFGLWWANLSCVVALGTALVLVGHERSDNRLIVLGLVLAGVAKILPAVPLAIWLVWRHRAWRPVSAAVLIGLALTAAVVAIKGPAVITDFITVTLNATQETGVVGNVAPSLLLTPLLGTSLAGIAGLVAGLTLLVAGLWPRRDPRLSLVLLLLAACALVPNLWVHWLLAPMVVAIAWQGPLIRRQLELVAP